MKKNMFQSGQPHIVGNQRLRKPQKELFEAVEKWSATGTDREVSAILPVGSGKTGCLVINPFAFKSKRTLIVAPGLQIAEQILNNFNPDHQDNFYKKCNILNDGEFPIAVGLRDSETNFADLENADVVVTNVHQLQPKHNGWLSKLPADFFDLIEFDEGHHNIAFSWKKLREHFSHARIINYSATPERTDGETMIGKIIYQFAIAEATALGYSKRLKVRAVCPESMTYRSEKDGVERIIYQNEIRRLGHESAAFRSATITDRESYMAVIVASKVELEAKREATGESRIKIIAAGRNFTHCAEIVEAYRELGLRADYVHSLNDIEEDQKVLERLNNHELDVIVQVRKLGEGFDHPWLCVAAVLNNFSQLPPFYQFVGRTMRVLVQNDPGHPLNSATVIYHAGTNQKARVDELIELTSAGDDYYENAIEEEVVEFSNLDDLARERSPNEQSKAEILGQSNVVLEDREVVTSTDMFQRYIGNMLSQGLSLQDINEIYQDSLKNRLSPGGV